MPQHGGVRRRWWLPGAVVAGGTAVVGWVGTTAWYAFEDAGCGSPGAKFVCLGETILAAGVALVLGPVLLGLAYRAAGVRRPLPSVVLAVLLAWVLGALPVLLDSVADQAGVSDAVPERYPPSLVAAILFLASAGGALAWQGPRRALRAAVGAVSLLLLCAATLALESPADRARDGSRLAEATVPLLLPSQGWQPHGPYVREDGSLAYDAVPVGWPGYGFEGVRVHVRHGTGDFGSTCGFRVCADSGDVRYEVPDPAESGSGTQAWRVVDGHLVSVQTYGDGGPTLDPVAFLRGMAPVDRSTFLDRRFTDR